MTRPSVRMTGPLVPHVEGFHANLIELGYTPLSAVKQIQLAAHVSRWLESQRLEPQELTSQRIEQFLRARRRAGYVGWRSRRAVAPLLTYLLREQVLLGHAVYARSDGGREVSELRVARICAAQDGCGLGSQYGRPRGRPPGSWANDRIRSGERKALEPGCGAAERSRAQPLTNPHGFRGFLFGCSSAADQFPRPNYRV